MILRYLRRYDFRGAASVEATASGAAAEGGSGVAVADIVLAQWVAVSGLPIQWGDVAAAVWRRLIMESMFQTSVQGRTTAASEDRVADMKSVAPNSKSDSDFLHKSFQPP